MPLRTYTTASNFAFVFVALTIVVAEMGGRAAAVVTALVSALSLDFFLTQPYMRLTIHEKHDVYPALRRFFSPGAVSGPSGVGAAA